MNRAVAVAVVGLQKWAWLVAQPCFGLREWPSSASELRVGLVARIAISVEFV